MFIECESMKYKTTTLKMAVLYIDRGEVCFSSLSPPKEVGDEEEEEEEEEDEEEEEVEEGEEGEEEEEAGEDLAASSSPCSPPPPPLAVSFATPSLSDLPCWHRWTPRPLPQVPGNAWLLATSSSLRHNSLSSGC